MKWSEEKCLKLIEVYKRMTVLWDPKDQNYYRKNVKDHAWDIIGEIMGTTTINCRQKMVNLLASFRREKMKTKNGGPFGKEPGKVYRSRWFAFNAFQFLQERDNPRQRRISNSNCTADKENENVEEDEDSESSPEPVRKKAKEDPEIEMLKEAVGILKTEPEQSSPRHSSVTNHELECFTNFVLEKMKNYSTTTKNLVQREIGEVLFKADQGFFENYGFSQQLNNADNSKATNLPPIVEFATPSTSYCSPTYDNSSSAQTGVKSPEHWSDSD